jgi:hypothetical protein
MNEEDVNRRISSARLRLEDVLTLNKGNLPGADASERLRLVQEFFFHLLGTIDVIAHVVNERRALGLNAEEVTLAEVINRVPRGDALRPHLELLRARVRNQPIPADPYTDESLIFRAYNYRHQVTHRHRNPFVFRVGGAPPASFLLDPRDPNSGPSAESAQDEMQRMLEIVEVGCRNVLAVL